VEGGVGGPGYHHRRRVRMMLMVNTRRWARWLVLGVVKALFCAGVACGKTSLWVIYYEESNIKIRG
jgi:hypothetical protein